MVHADGRAWRKRRGSDRANGHAIMCKLLAYKTDNTHNTHTEHVKAVVHTEPLVMDAFRAYIANGLLAHGCPLSPEQVTALGQVLAGAAEQDEGISMAMNLMENLNRELEGVQAEVRRVQAEVRRWADPTLFVSDSIPQNAIAHPARSAALAAQGQLVDLADDVLALAPGPPNMTRRFRYFFKLQAEACVCTDIDLATCQRYRFINGMLHIDWGDGNMQMLPAHITQIYDTFAPDDRVDDTSMTIDDQVTGTFIEEVVSISHDWLTGNDITVDVENAYS